MDDFTVTHNSGKTTLGAAMCSGALERQKRVLWIAHTTELIDQPVATFRSFGMRVGILQGSRTPDPDAHVQVASIQTLRQRTMPAADLIVLDEAHLHVGTGSARSILSRVPDAAYVVGLTASPDRLDGRPMGDVYDQLVTIAKPSELLGRFILEPVVYAPSQPDVTNVAKRGGEFVRDQLAAVCGTDRLVGDVVEQYEQKVRGRGVGPAALLFAVSIPHAMQCRDAFRARGITSEVVHGGLDDRERARVIDAFKAGDITVVCNVEVLTTGFDFQALGCVICARPTQSLALWLQISGRSLRFLPGKPRPIILDHAGNTYRHGLPHADRDWVLRRPGEPAPSYRTGPLATCPRCYAVFPPRRTCPACGLEFERDGRMPKIIGGDLVEVVDAPVLTNLRDQKRQEFDRLCKMAVDNHLTREFVRRAFDKRFGHSPRGFEWPDSISIDWDAERRKLERTARSKGLTTAWVTKRLDEMMAKTSSPTPSGPSGWRSG